jgi:flagellar motor switch protein FliN/FliY
MTDDEMPQEEGQPVNQDAVDDIFDETAGAADGGAMNLSEIQDDTQSEEDQNPYNVGEAMAGDVTAIYEIPVQISAVLGRSTMQVSQLLKLGRGAVVELDRKVGEAIDIYVNNRLVARGEVVVVEDKLGVTMTEIIKSDRG